MIAKKFAQSYHYDMDHITWIKIFYYLTEVSIENGPHMYVPGSHLPGMKDMEVLKKGYVRHEDQVIEKRYRQEPVSITGKAGTLFMGNTLCWHKGNRVRSGYRMMIAITVTPDGAFR